MALYAIVSHQDDKTSLDYFTSKKVPKENVIPIERIKALAGVLKQNDIVYTVGVNRFCSAQTFYFFWKHANSVGVVFKCLSNPYLEFGNGRQLKPAIVHHIETLATVELALTKFIHQYFKLSSWNQTIIDVIYSGMVQI